MAEITPVAQEAVAQEVAAAKEGTTINVGGNHDYAKEDTNFYFRPDKLGNKRDTVVIPLPLLTLQGIVSILEGGDEKQINLLIEAANSIIISQARGIVSDNLEINKDNFPYAETTWEFIANIPPATRTGGGIPADTWEAFGADYIKVIQAAANKTEEQATLASKILVSKFSGQYKHNKPVIQKLKEQLSIYFNATENKEDFKQCVDFLVNKADDLLSMDESKLLANL